MSFHPAAATDPALERLRIEALALFDLPFNDLLFRAHTAHRENFDPNRVQRSTLLSIKTGGCPEDCGYCPQAKRYHTGVEDEELLTLEQVTAAARAAKEHAAAGGMADQARDLRRCSTWCR